MEYGLHFNAKNHTRVFPKVYNSGNYARIVLEQNKFSKKVTSNRD